MTNQIKLSPAELSMITLTREKEALAAKEKEVQHAIQLEKDIAAKKAEIAKIQFEDFKQIDAAKAFAKQFNSDYQLTIETTQMEKSVTGGYIDDCMDNKRIVLWNEWYGRQSATIKHKDGYVIQIKEHIVYSRKWSLRGTSKGYVMYVSGPGIGYPASDKAITRVSTVIKNIENAIQVKANSIKLEENKKNALQFTVDRFQAEYPDAIISTDYGFEKSYGRMGRVSTGNKFDIVRITFANATTISFRVYADKSLSRQSYTIPTVSNNEEFMKTLSQLKF